MCKAEHVRAQHSLRTVDWYLEVFNALGIATFEKPDDVVVRDLTKSLELAVVVALQLLMVTHLRGGANVVGHLPNITHGLGLPPFEAMSVRDEN
jgi:hypothetical protein